MCGLEAMVLALQLAKELVDKPWPTSGIIVADAVYRAPWVEKRREADRQETYNKKLIEFEAMVDMCLPNEKPICTFESPCIWDGPRLEMR
jgi:hypothetical protein